MILPSRLTAAGQARQYVSDALRGAQPPAVLATAVLLTSELVANAVVHGSPPVTLRILPGAQRLRVEVDDGGVAAAPDRDAPVWSLSTETGRGLLLVQTLAMDWGRHPHRHATRGQTSWFELGPEPA